MIVNVNINAFKEARVKKGFSQRELAKRAKLSNTLISQIENNERNPSPGSAKKICDTLEVQFDDIFFASSVCDCKRSAAQCLSNNTVQIATKEVTLKGELYNAAT